MRFVFAPALPWLRGLFWLGASVLVLWGLGWLLLPPIIRHQLETAATDKLGRQVRVERVAFTPWTLRLALHGLSVGPTAGGTDRRPQFQVRRLTVDASLASLFRLAPVVDAVEIEAPALRLTHLGGGRYDIDDLLQRLRGPERSDGAALPAFALHNLVLSGGSVDVTDLAAGQTHELRELTVSLPFVSSLASDRERPAQPRLAFELNGSRFDASASVTPFGQARRGELQLKLKALDLAPFLHYLPDDLPVRLASAVLSTDLRVAFDQVPADGLRISGTLQADRVKLLAARAGAAAEPELLAIERLQLGIDALRPFDRQLRLGTLDLFEPRLSVSRDASGQLDLPQLSSTDATKKEATNPSPTGLDSQNSGPYGGWTLSLARVAVTAGSLSWRDQSTVPPARLSLQDLSLAATSLALPADQPMQFEASAALSGASQPERAANPKGARLNLSGQVSQHGAELAATVRELPVALGAPYLSRWLKPTLAGTLQADLGLTWVAAGQAGAGLQVAVNTLTVDKLDLSQGSARLAGLQQLRVAQAQVDLERQTVSVGQLALRGPRTQVSREADGRWMFEEWLVPQPAQASPAQQGPPWTLSLRELALDDGAVGFVDRVPARPVALEVKALSLRLNNLSSAGRRPVLLRGDLQLQAGTDQPGRLSWQGQGGLNPPLLQANMAAVRLPIHALEPYFAHMLNVALVRADGSFKGGVRYTTAAAGPELQISGDTAVEDLRVRTLSGSGEDPLTWKLLDLRGLDLALAPGSPLRVAVAETVLSDFYARLELDETGRLNALDVLKPQSAIAANAVAASEPEVPEPLVRLGPVSLINGRVDFSDNFIKPNYSAKLTELTGRLGAFSSQPRAGAPELAELSVRGRAQGTATLDIEGLINPLARPLALDLKARVRDLELPQLSPYAVRYAGYGIERGKLSVDLSYQVQPDGQLVANNNIVLNQLTFGDKVEGAPASLPVKLAVALLADRRGVIGIDLPVSGSINDPEFKLMPLVFKLIGNLLVRAVTAPFSLIGRALAGPDELSQVEFDAGSAVLPAAARAALDKVADVLLERPALQMTVVGQASPDVEREAFRREQLMAQVLAERRRLALLGGATPAAVAALTVPESGTDDYAALLLQVYQRADIPKPRTAQGALQTLLQQDMENLLMSHQNASEEQIRVLGVQRGVAVRDYLATRDVPADRLFLGPARVVPPEATWRPRAELSLSTP